ncbi:uncharacterized protein L203_101588 [Cryptococcus depauperatus CBS 7841]|uniref:Signal transducer n=1 Tax=Cryptococcus depauperatus CBS 7841 TaxID=1295531 RepID=A0AAJ8JQ69_9TREE
MAPSSTLSNNADTNSPAAAKSAQGQLSGSDGFPAISGIDTMCGGCNDPIDQESGGVVVAFGQKLWHVECFRCTKCREKVSADTNLLLLSDGSPVCGKCSYQCFVCKEAITEEAIMTGEESYHANCFTCRTCKKKIEELVFAKTSQGIYCMSCHNERVAKSRRHAEAKRQRQARREEREREKREKEGRESEQRRLEQHRGGVNSPSYLNAGSTPHPQQSQSFANGMAIPSPRPPTSPFNQTLPQGQTRTQNQGEEEDDSLGASEKTKDLSVKQIVPRSSSPAGRQLTEAQNMPLPASPSESLDGKPLKPSRPTHSQSHSMGLSVPTTTKAERRRSINPGMTFSFNQADLGGTGGYSGERLSAHQHSPLHSGFTDSQAEQSARKSSRSPSPSGNLSFPFKDDAGGQTQPEQSHETNVSISEYQSTKTSFKGENQLKEVLETPKLHAPDLPNMSFSLSDPDFAVILSNMDQSPHKNQPNVTLIDRDRQRTEVDFIPSGESAPSSPLITSPSLARSPYMDMLSAVEPNPQAHSVTPLNSRDRLSPNDLTPHRFNRRQTSADSAISIRSRHGDGSFEKIVEILARAKHNEEESVNVDTTLLVGIVREVEDLREALTGLKNKYTGVKRSSQQYSEGLSVAGEEYDKERSKRTELEAEVSRLRAQLHSQTARLSVISGDERRAENMKRRSKDLASNLTGLERDISRLKAERDIKLAEVDELVERTQSGLEIDPNTMSQSLGLRLETIRTQYAKDIESLSSQTENLQREIAELLQIKEDSLEESVALAAKNEDLAELNAQLTKQAENLQENINRNRPPTVFSKKSHLQNSPSLASLTGQSLQDVPEETVTARVVKVTKPEPIEAAPVKRFKWYKSSKGPDASNTPANISRPLASENNNKSRGGMSLGMAGLAIGGIGGGGARPSTEFGTRDHTFQQHTMMRFTRCELCGEKMWGLQEVKCSSCGIVSHSKCAEKLPRGCTGNKVAKDEPDGPLPPSMFGRPLVEQTVTDKQSVPAIVTKCIAAVEAVGMEYEGIYRKTGGSSQSKQITLLFERGDYDAFDLTDVDSFNDISSVTSVLKTYFRSLPNPLLTHELHESFVTAATIRDINNKRQAVCALLKELPREHYNTLKALMLHLNRVTSHSSVNLMTSQNLGVVFGPTLMRSPDPNREFGDMAGKALSIQWLVENAPSLFNIDRD